MFLSYLKYCQRLNWCHLHRQRLPPFLWWLFSKKKKAPPSNVRLNFQLSKCQGGPLAVCAFVCSMVKSRSVACVVQQWAWAVQNLVGNAGEKVPLQHCNKTVPWVRNRNLFSEHSLFPWSPTHSYFCPAVPKYPSLLYMYFCTVIRKAMQHTGSCTFV